MEIDRRLSKDRRRARITLPVATFDVKVEGIKEIVAALGATRSVMLPEEPTAFVPPKSVHAIPEPGWTAILASDGFITAYQKRRHHNWEIIF
jgi:hypothetical protein